MIVRRDVLARLAKLQSENMGDASSGTMSVVAVVRILRTLKNGIRGVGCL